MRENATSSIMWNRLVTRALKAVNTNLRNSGDRAIRSSNVSRGMATARIARLGNRLCWIILIAHQARRRQRAALAGRDPIEHDLTPAFGDLLHTNAAIQEHQIAFGSMPGAVYPAALWQRHYGAILHQASEQRFRQPLKARKRFDPPKRPCHQVLQCVECRASTRINIIAESRQNADLS